MQGPFSVHLLVALLLIGAEALDKCRGGGDPQLPCITQGGRVMFLLNGVVVTSSAPPINTHQQRRSTTTTTDAASRRDGNLYMSHPASILFFEGDCDGNPCTSPPVAAATATGIVDDKRPWWCTPGRRCPTVPPQGQRPTCRDTPLPDGATCPIGTCRSGECVRSYSDDEGKTEKTRSDYDGDAYLVRLSSMTTERPATVLPGRVFSLVPLSTTTTTKCTIVIKAWSTPTASPSVHVSPLSEAPSISAPDGSVRVTVSAACISYETIEYAALVGTRSCRSDDDCSGSPCVSGLCEFGLAPSTAPLPSEDAITLSHLVATSSGDMFDKRTIPCVEECAHQGTDAARIAVGLAYGDPLYAKCAECLTANYWRFYYNSTSCLHASTDICGELMASDRCIASSRCDGATGRCAVGRFPCDDGDPCMADTCYQLGTSQRSCRHTRLPDGSRVVSADGCSHLICHTSTSSTFDGNVADGTACSVKLVNAMKLAKCARCRSGTCSLMFLDSQCSS